LDRVVVHPAEGPPVVLQGTSYRDLAEEAWAAILDSHVRRANQPATLEIHLDDPDRLVDVVVTCAQCQRPGMQERVPRWMFAAVVLAFHTDHEGHAMRIEVDGRVIESPHFQTVSSKKKEAAPRFPTNPAPKGRHGPHRGRGSR